MINGIFTSLIDHGRSAIKMISYPSGLGAFGGSYGHLECDQGTEAVPITPQWLQNVAPCNVTCTTPYPRVSTTRSCQCVTTYQRLTRASNSGPWQASVHSGRTKMSPTIIGLSSWGDFDLISLFEANCSGQLFIHVTALCLSIFPPIFVTHAPPDAFYLGLAPLGPFTARYLLEIDLRGTLSPY